MSGQHSRQPEFWPLLIPALLSAATFAAFLPALSNQFVDMDDWLNFVTNPHYRGLGWTQVKWMFGDAAGLGHYIPLTWLTLGLDFVVWGMNPFGYHLSSLLLHCANAVLMFYVSRRLLAAAVPEATPSDKGGLDLAAGFAALLFSLHPLRVESVAWVTERRDVLSGLFYLLTVRSYLAAAAEAQRPGQRLRLAAVLGFFALTLLSKISGITLPLALIALDVYPLKRLPGDPRRWGDPVFRGIWTEKALLMLLALPAAAMGFWAEKQFGTLRSFDDVSLAGRLALSAFAPIFYIRKTLAPFDLLPLYELALPFDPRRAIFLASGVACIVLSLAFYKARDRFPAGLAAWTAYLATLLPTMGLVAIGMQLAADRNTYLATMGWAVLAGAALRRFWADAQERPRVRLGLAMAVVSILAGLGALTWRQTQRWRDSETLWAYVLSIDETSFTAHYSYASLLSAKGDIGSALPHFDKAAALHPSHAGLHYNWGLALSRAGRWDEAIARYREALRLKPGSSAVYFNLGSALAANGNAAAAVEAFEKVLELEPEVALAHSNIGVILGSLGRSGEALERYRAALLLDPRLSEAHTNLGLTLARMGKPQEAAEHFRQALSLNPDDTAAQKGLDIASAHLARRRPLNP